MMPPVNYWSFDLRVRSRRSTTSLQASTNLRRYGKPVAFYSDKASIFRVNAKEAVAGVGYTQFGRAMQDLNIDIICANTAAAKGRVERAHQTRQDRLVKELRLRGISDSEAGNAYLYEFREDYNRRSLARPEMRVTHTATCRRKTTCAAYSHGKSNTLQST